MSGILLDYFLFGADVSIDHFLYDEGVIGFAESATGHQRDGQIGISVQRHPLVLSYLL